MALIKDLSTFQKFFKVSFTYNELKALPPVAKAETRYILPIIGKTLMDDLQAQVNANSITKLELYNCICAVTAPLSILQNLASRHLKMTDAGLKKTVSENTESVFNWEFKEYREELQNEVAEALDELWRHLYENADTYTWTDPNPYDLLFKSADDLKKYYPFHQPYRVFSLLQPVMWEVEDHFITGAIGEDFFDDLKELHAASLKVADPDADPPTDEEKAIQKKINKALDLLKKAVAYYTMHKAVDRLPVKLTQQGFTVLFNDAGDATYKGDQRADMPELERFGRSCLQDGNAYITQLRRYLNNNASVDLFATYFSSNKYEAPGIVKTNPNEGLTGLMNL